jgi:hypothetical protein
MTQSADHGPHFAVEYRYLDEIRRHAQAESLMQSHARGSGAVGLVGCLVCEIIFGAQDGQDETLVLAQPLGIPLWR